MLIVRPISTGHNLTSIQKLLRFLLGLLPLILPVCWATSDPAADIGLAPAIPVKLDQHNAKPPNPLSFMGVYATNFNETPYCCPWSPKAFELAPPPTAGWGVVPMTCQVADSGENGIFNANGTVLLGNSWLLSNGSVAYFGHAGSRNGAYYFGFASDAKVPPLKTFSGFFTFQDEKDSTEDGGDLTGPWLWTYLREPTVAECKYALRETADTVSPLS